MYEEFFGLSGSPFKLNPDPKFFFGSRSHNKAMAYLHYGLKQAEGFIVITGPVGAGKSMVIGHLLDQLDRSNIIAAQLLTSNVGPGELLDHILSAFRIEPEGEGRTGQLEAFEDYLFDQLQRGRRALLIMDEAQNLPRETLEELRMLSNLDYHGTPLFQVFLVGQPEFRDTLGAADMEQLKQRVIASYHLEDLSDEETREYVLHRLAVVGWRQDPAFAEEAFDAIYAETKGRPRRINTLCNRLMLYCSFEDVHEVTAETIKIVVAELHEEKLGSETNSVEPARAAMPPVQSVDAKSSAKPVHDDEKVIAIDEVRDRSRKTSPEAAESSGSESSSVFDRLRAKRGNEPERQEATLSDVASAIAAASAGGPAENELAGEETPTSAPAAAWRGAAVRSIDDAREDLKQANSNIRRLRGALQDSEKRQNAKRAQIAEALSKADALLGELRRAGR